MEKLIFRKKKIFLMVGLLLVGILMFSVPAWTIIANPGVGDLSENGAITASDVLRLRRYIVGGWGISIDESLGDCNNNGSVTASDVLRLRRFIVGGWGAGGDLNSQSRLPEIIKVVPVNGGQVATNTPTFVVTFSESMDDITSSMDCALFWMRNEGPQRTVGITVGNHCNMISNGVPTDPYDYLTPSFDKNNTVLNLQITRDEPSVIILRNGSSYTWSIDIFDPGELTPCGSCPVGTGVLDAGGESMHSDNEDIPGPSYPAPFTFSVAP